jgi:hypothetical protein
LPSVTDFELIISSFSEIVRMGVYFLKYVHIGPISLFDVIVCMMVVEVVGWLIEAAKSK